jgi:hypothetical protein
MSYKERKMPCKDKDRQGEGKGRIEAAESQEISRTGVLGRGKGRFTLLGFRGNMSLLTPRL